MKAARLWFVAAYVLATLLAQGGHDHRIEDDRDKDIVCAGDRAGFDGHGAHGSDPLGLDCPACQFRAQPPLAPIPTFTPALVRTDLKPVGAAADVRAPALRRPSSRAPPGEPA